MILEIEKILLAQHLKPNPLKIPSIKILFN